MRGGEESGVCGMRGRQVEDVWTEFGKGAEEAKEAKKVE